MPWRDQLAQQLTAPARIHFTRRGVFASKTDEIWTADVAYMTAFAQVNEDYNYILVCLDVFSRYAYCAKMKDKSAQETANAFSTFLSPNNRPIKLWTDDGTEFLGAFKNMLKTEKIKWYSIYNVTKAMIAERFIRNLRLRIQREFIKNESTVWITHLDAIVLDYNNTRHRSIGTTPTLARLQENHNSVYLKLYTPTPARIKQLSKLKQKFQIGDRVRISRYRRIFEKESSLTYTEETFTIFKILPTIPITYKLKDYNNEILKGGFYQSELRLTNINKFRIDKILGKRIHNGIPQSLVRWFGHSDKFDSWEPDDELDIRPPGHHGN